ncbi:hypothetical protein, partial [Streptomyces sp. NPDC014892]
EQVANKDSNITDEIRDGGNKFYTPIWNDLGTYDVSYKSTEIGANKVKLQIEDNINLFAHMYVHIDSETIDQDAILLKPVNGDDPFPEGLPAGWTQSDIDWITK